MRKLKRLDEALLFQLGEIPAPGQVDARLIPALEALVTGLSRRIFGEGSRTTGEPPADA